MAAAVDVTNLVKVLQEVDYPALNLLLVQASGGRVETDTLVGEARSELSRASNGKATDLERCRGSDGTRHRSSQRADDGGTEHGAELEEKRCAEEKNKMSTSEIEEGVE